jgi:hypothetical protein
LQGWIAVVTALGGCGRIGFAAMPDGPCVLGPWSTIQPIPELAGPGIAYGGQITPDGLTLYFDSNRGGDEEIYVTHRPDRMSPFAPPQHLAELGSPNFDGDATVAGDELELLFDRSVSGSMEILRTTRATTTAMWDPPATIAIPGSVAGPALSVDGLTLFYNSVLDNVSEGEIYVTTRVQRNDPFEPGVAVAVLDGMPNRGYASVSPDGLLLLFEVESGQNGHLELWQSTRASPSDPFVTPERIPELASGTDDSDPSITADLRELFFASARGTGTPALYVASRDCL